MKTLILTAFHRRPEISRIYWTGVNRLRQSFDVETMAVISKGDMHNLKLAEMYSDYICISENKPVGTKHNNGVAAIKSDYDMLMQLGSDDLIADELMMLNEEKFKSGSEFFGSMLLGVINIYTKKYKIFVSDHVFGAGRCMSRRIVERSSPMFPALNTGLDSRSQTKIGLQPDSIHSEIPLVYDIKGSLNVWGYDVFKGEERSIEEIGNLPEIKQIINESNKH